MNSAVRCIVAPSPALMAALLVLLRAGRISLCETPQGWLVWLVGGMPR